MKLNIKLNAECEYLHALITHNTKPSIESSHFFINKKQRKNSVNLQKSYSRSSRITCNNKTSNTSQEKMIDYANIARRFKTSINFDEIIGNFIAIKMKKKTCVGVLEFSHDLIYFSTPCSFSFEFIIYVLDVHQNGQYFFFVFRNGQSPFFIPCACTYIRPETADCYILFLCIHRCYMYSVDLL